MSNNIVHERSVVGPKVTIVLIARRPRPKRGFRPNRRVEERWSLQDSNHLALAVSCTKMRLSFVSTSVSNNEEFMKHSGLSPLSV